MSTKETRISLKSTLRKGNLKILISLLRKSFIKAVASLHFRQIQQKNIFYCKIIIQFRIAGIYPKQAKVSDNLKTKKKHSEYIRSNLIQPIKKLSKEDFGMYSQTTQRNTSNSMLLTIK